VGFVGRATLARRRRARVDGALRGARRLVQLLGAELVEAFHLMGSVQGTIAIIACLKKSTTSRKLKLCQLGL